MNVDCSNGTIFYDAIEFIRNSSPLNVLFDFQDRCTCAKDYIMSQELDDCIRYSESGKTTKQLFLIFSSFSYFCFLIEHTFRCHQLASLWNLLTDDTRERVSLDVAKDYGIVKYHVVEPLRSTFYPSHRFLLCFYLFQSYPVNRVNKKGTRDRHTCDQRQRTDNGIRIHITSTKFKYLFSGFKYVKFYYYY